MSDPELLREVARWVRYARDDLKVAELILEHGQVPRAACFNAQQCAEKAMKASLIFLQIPFRKINAESAPAFCPVSVEAVDCEDHV